jgi:hypothetical protein
MRRVLVLFALLLAACAHLSPNGFVSDRLFCGLSIPTGGTVTQPELDRFIEEVVTPRFPQGFTVWRAKGQWNGGNEEVMVLEIVHPNDPAQAKAVAEIATAYRTRFHQEAVLRVIAAAHMEMDQ